MEIYAGVSKSRFTVVSIQNSLFLYYYLLIIVVFSTQTTINLLLPTPAYISTGADKEIIYIQPPALKWHLLCAGHCSKRFTNIISANPQNNPVSLGIIIIFISQSRKLNQQVF